MKTLILKIDDSNMAGFDWTWSFFINKTAKGSFTVSRTQLLDGRTVRFPGSSGLKSGNEVLGAVYYMLDEFSYRLGDYDLDKIAQKIGSV
ncbi:MAG: hypothetical protein EBY18_20710, partial [Alphaproteobacteria bacterium]|nr:hypothetical protein [Alphaproteobacteria bacterium]